MVEVQFIQEVFVFLSVSTVLYALTIPRSTQSWRGKVGDRQ